MTLYAGYLYAYPHKTAYRPLEPPIPLEEVWAGENKESLFLYFHVPFCEMRCGFCNLFTAAHPKEEAVSDYLAQLERQAAATSKALGTGARFARFAVGGGTPTYLEAPALERLFALADRAFGARPAAIPTSMETSPETATRARLSVLAAHGVSRVSIGVQSFDEKECASIGRPQETARVHAALDAIRSERFTTLNIDLIYGLPAQTPESFAASIRAALAYRPEELYLYPLYVRPLTGLGRKGKSWDDQRLELYRSGRALLIDEGYRQVSMRMFRREAARDPMGLIYCCQSDGMVGLGPGARSYTRALHYSSEWAVSARGVKEIIGDWSRRAELGFADYGIALDAMEQRRRWLILSLLAEGIDGAAYRARFGTEADEDFPELAGLCREGLAACSGGRIELTERGVERSDAIGPSLCSETIRARMAEYSLQ